MHKDFLRNSNLRESKGSMNMSANCYLVGTNSREITLPSTKSVIKWWWISMCLVQEWRIGFLERFIALELSQWMFIVLCSIPWSLSNHFIQRSWVQQLPTTIYYASLVDKDIEFCFLLCQATQQSLIKK